MPKNTTSTFLKQLIFLYRSEKKYLAAVGLWRFFYEVSKLIDPFLFKFIIDFFISFEKENLITVVWLVGAVFIINLFTSLLSFMQSKVDHEFLSHLFNYLPFRAHAKLLELPMAYHEEENTHRKLHKINRGMAQFENFTVNVIFELFPTLLQTVLTFSVVFFLNWQLALLFPIFIPLFLIITWYMNKKARPLRECLRETYHERQKKMGESISYVRTVQEYVQEEREKEKVFSITNKIIDQEDKREKIIRSFDLGRDLILNLARVCTIAFGAYQTFLGIITPGSLVMFITYSEKVYMNLYRLSRFYDRMADCMPAVEDLSSIFEQESSIQDIPDAVELGELEGDIVFDQVSFAYKESKEVLETISFHAKPHEIVALVGPSGSGKSTIIKLLYRHFEVTSGKVLLDGIDIRKLRRAFFRSKMAIVPQEIDIFDTTVAENITYALPDALPKEVESAARAAYIHDFIFSLPQGYDTHVGERGIKLSGGQKQRLGIARALLAKPAILILDEATSSLDSESEILIHKAINEVARQSTMLIIAHRLSTIRKADKIIVLDHGKIVEVGTHEMLKNKVGGLYARLYSLQNEGVIL